MHTFWRRFGWQPGQPAWGAATIAGLGCALPLVLGLFSGHPGFLWATIGAFQAVQANPLHRLGMLRMLLLIALGALGAGLGFWAAAHALSSLAVFAACGLMLAWLHRYGREASKLGAGLAICLCLGQGHHGLSEFSNPQAIAMLVILGGLWVTLLAFGLRGLHGLRMWPYMPRLRSLIRVLRRRARRIPIHQWRLQATTHLLVASSSGLLVVLADLPYGYWLTLAALATLQMHPRPGVLGRLQAGVGVLLTATILVYLGHSLADPPVMLMIMLPLLMLGRLFHAQHYQWFMLYITLGFILLSETLTPDWSMPQARLLNAVMGVGLAVGVTLLVYLLPRLVARIAQGRNGKRGPAQPVPAPRRDDQLKP